MLRFSMMNRAPLLSWVRTLKSKWLLARAALCGCPGTISTCFDEMNGALLFVRKGRERAQRKGSDDFQHRTTVELMHRVVPPTNVAMLVDHSRSEKGRLAKDLSITH